MTNFKKVNPKQNFPSLEEEILNFWKENDIFKKSLETRKNGEEFNFYDGPPFATGTPHYGHILAGTIKDVIPRYQTMLGKRVDRVFGWDCHGLPIENIVEKKIGINGKEDIECKVGVFEFNENCRANVFAYVDEWRKTVERMGRWVDMENDYKTMDTAFMESVWWVFKNIYDKGLIYEGRRVVPYCPRCTTPLSNFEVNQGYKDKQSKTVVVRFKVKGNENKYILAWTTTPWTLYANLGLAVGKDIDYVELLDKTNGDTYILAKEKVKDFYKNEEDYQVVREYCGECLVGIKYEPVFVDFQIQLEEMGKNLGSEIRLGKNAWTVQIGHHVTTETGTGIVHIAPAYGEDDYIIGQKEDLGFVAHIDNTGKTYNLLENNHKFVFDFNETVIEELKSKKLSVNIGTIVHSYPYCWRCDTPLIYRAISAWYVAVEKFRDKMVENNKKITWVPEAIKYGRFGNWIEQARDWNISRNRYWGSAIPVWQSEDKKKEICIGSIEELYELNKDYGQIEKRGDKYFYTKYNIEVDIHKHYVDEIKLKHPETGDELKRIPEVLDCWFESGAMPYASKHYPFENADNFKFPADFIAEGLDQTRGWFYTLLVLGTALFDNTPFLNCIVNGVVLAEDGKKMSKSLKNYPDPELIFDKYGADAMRFYLMNSPVVEAQDFRFAENGVDEIVKKVILPLWNTYSFFTTYANVDNYKVEKGSIYFCRHGQTTNNEIQIKNGGDVMMSGGDSEAMLTEKGKKQAKEAGINFNHLGEKIDLIISSPRIRAQDTAKIIAKEIGYEGEIIVDDRFNEIREGIFLNMTHSQIQAYAKKEYNLDLKPGFDTRKFFKNGKYNKVEDVVDFDKRVIEAYSEIEKKYMGKNVLIIAHTGVFRPINRYLNNIDFDDAHYNLGSIQNATIFKMPKQRHNILDKWIISELNKLILDVKTGLDNYKINEATRPVMSFMDSLTNWYIRRSRKRFWAEGMQEDKKEAYDTLYEVLVGLSKVFAPFMPFISEYIYKNLTGKVSVHLDNFPNVNKSFILNTLNTSFDKTAKLVNLGLAFRARHKIRVRQVLKSATIGEKLDDYYLEILKEELNLKEIKVLNDPSKIAKKVCRPNAKLIGPKYGKDVQKIIIEAKNGNFQELEEGKVKVGEYILEINEYEIAYEKLDESMDIEAGFGMVISIDPTLTEELLQEGYSRDLVRFIQESRKEAGFEVSDRIQLELKTESLELSKSIKKFKTYIQDETLSTIIEKIDNSDFKKEVLIDEYRIEIVLKKV